MTHSYLQDLKCMAHTAVAAYLRSLRFAPSEEDLKEIVYSIVWDLVGLLHKHTIVPFPAANEEIEAIDRVANDIVRSFTEGTQCKD